MPEIGSALDIAKLVDEMRRAGSTPTEQDWNLLASQISNVFAARREEVAILRVSADATALNFVLPSKLSLIGAIPLTAAYSLATRTVREKHGEIVNNFPGYKHPTVFEAVDLSKEEKAFPIQKIMSSPMIVGGKVVGVIQISRKARPGEPVGPDFTHAELAQLATVGSILARLLSELPTTSTIHTKPSANP